MAFKALNTRTKRRVEYLQLAVRRATRPNDRILAVVHNFPENPYQGLIYSAWSQHIIGTDMLTAEKLKRWRLITDLHLHWDEYLFPLGQPDMLQASVATIEAVKKSGGKVIFTVHNAAPHDHFDDPETITHFRKWRHWVLRQSDAVHVHSRAAREVILAEYDVPAKRLHVVPHPSYAGVFAPVERPNGFTDRRRFLSFGNVRRNKGVPSLIEAVRRLVVPGRDVELHLAGRGAQAFEGTRLGGNRLILSPGFVPDAEIPRLFADAEFCVFGFDSALTSGSLMLALTLGKPVIVPKYPSLMEIFDGGPAPLSFTPGDVEDLTATLARAALMDSDAIAEMAAESLRTAKSFDPASISNHLETALAFKYPPQTALSEAVT